MRYGRHGLQTLPPHLRIVIVLAIVKGGEMVDDDRCVWMTGKSLCRIDELVGVALQVEGQSTFAHECDALGKYRITHEVSTFHLWPGEVGIAGMVIENHAHPSQPIVCGFSVPVEQLSCVLHVFCQMYVGDDTEPTACGDHLLAYELRFSDGIDHRATLGLPHDGLHVDAGGQFQPAGQLRHIRQVVVGQIDGLVLLYSGSQIRIGTLVNVPQMEVRITKSHRFRFHEGGWDKVAVTSRLHVPSAAQAVDRRCRFAPRPDPPSRVTLNKE